VWLDQRVQFNGMFTNPSRATTLKLLIAERAETEPLLLLRAADSRCRSVSGHFRRVPTALIQPTKVKRNRLV
jgi:hypothetical protein